MIDGWLVASIMAVRALDLPRMCSDDDHVGLSLLDAIGCLRGGR